MDYFLQQYEDKTYGYKGIDNLDNIHGIILSEQGENESREDYIKRCNLTFIKNQYGSNLALDIKANDTDCYVRSNVAEQNYGLDKLINDKERTVRIQVAKQNYGLERLINDKDAFVRSAVAEQGYGLQTLINDEDWLVRSSVARQNFGLDKLINDKSSEVRKAVVWQGYGLDKLINDKDYDVRKAALEAIQTFSCDDALWMTKLKAKLIDFIYKVDESNMLKVQSHYGSINEFFEDDSEMSYNTNETITILTVDTKQPIIELQKTFVNDNKSYRFIVDIISENNDNFIINVTVDSDAKFMYLLSSTINALKEFDLFYKYAEDLENCL